MNFAIFVSDDCIALREMVEGCREYRISGQVSVALGEEGKALQFARNERIPSYGVPNRDDAEASHEISEILQLYHADAIIVADHRRKLSSQILKQYPGRVFYIVPSACAEYIGSSFDEHQIHANLLAKEEKESAISVFSLDEETRATLVSQRKIRVFAQDSAETLAERIHFFEAEFIGAWLEGLTKSV